MMSSSQLLAMKSILEQNEYDAAIAYFSSLMRTAKINAVSFSMKSKISLKKCNNVLSLLVSKNILKRVFVVGCPECGIHLKETDSLSNIDKNVYCYNCDENVELSTDDVEIIYVFNEYPFSNRQQNTKFNTCSVAYEKSKNIYTLTQSIQNEDMDFCSEYFNPSESEISELKAMYENVFGKHKTTTDQGTSLENMVCYLFSLCAHFAVSTKVKVNINQIDCFVANKLYIAGISPADCRDCFPIECKNENKKPGITYLNKMHSILTTMHGNFGIIISKYPKPSTYNELANKIFLDKKMIIICLDRNDLNNIIYNNENLLRIIHKKIIEIKIDSRKDLDELDLSI